MFVIYVIRLIGSYRGSEDDVVFVIQFNKYLSGCGGVVLGVKDIEFIQFFDLVECEVKGSLVFSSVSVCDYVVKVIFFGNDSFQCFFYIFFIGNIVVLEFKFVGEVFEEGGKRF